MTNIDLTKLSELLLPEVLEAGHLMMELRVHGFSVDTKTDNSPVTEADKKVEKNLIRILSKIEPDIPVVAEEEMANIITPHMLSTDTFFLLDPLDGTRDFCENRDDFTINIGLIQNGHPVFGLIYAPARSEIFLTVSENESLFSNVSPYQKISSLEKLNPQPIRVRTGGGKGLHALVSRSETNEVFAERIRKLGANKITGMSSAIKFCLIARGDADIYPRYGATHEWDTAAGHAILNSAGGAVVTMEGTPLTYGKSQNHFLNGPFVARASN